MATTDDAKVIFEPSEVYVGPKSGFYFSTGSLGTGYYKDSQTGGSGSSSRPPAPKQERKADKRQREDELGSDGKEPKKKKREEQSDGHSDSSRESEMEQSEQPDPSELERTVTFLNGESKLLHYCATLIDVKVDAAAHLNTFYPYITVVAGDLGTVLTEENSSPPPCMSVVKTEPDKTHFGRRQWEKVVLRHAVRGDHRGARRALETLLKKHSSAVKNYINELLMHCVETFVAGKTSAFLYCREVEAVLAWQTIQPHVKCRLFFDKVAASLIRSNPNIKLPTWHLINGPFVIWAARNNFKDIVDACIAAATDAHLPVPYMTDCAELARLRPEHEAIIKALELTHSRLGLPDGTPAHGDTPMTLAVKHNDADTIRTLVASHADVNVPNAGNIPIVLAAEHKRQELVELLIEAKAVVNAKSHFGVSAIYAAVENDDRLLFRTLLGARADINAGQRRWKKSIIVVAAQQKRKGLVEMVISARANVNAPSAGGENALFVAIKHGSDEHGDMIRALVDAGADVNSGHCCRVSSVMASAVTHSGGALMLVERMIEHRADVNAMGRDGKTAIFFATIFNHVEILRVLLTNNADVNKEPRESHLYADRFWPIFAAVDNMQILQVELLIEYRANVNVKDDYGCTPLMQVIHDRNCHNIIEAVVNELIVGGINDTLAADEPSASTSSSCCSYSSKNSKRSRSSASVASSVRQQACPCFIFTALMDALADVNSANTVGNTPLSLAIDAGNKYYINALLAARADVNTKHPQGTPLLSVAISTAIPDDDEDIIECLIRGRANVNALDRFGRTPLIEAAARKNIAAVNALIEVRANVNMADSAGRTALTFTSPEEYGDVAKVLKRAGAVVPEEVPSSSSGDGDASADVTDVDESDNDVFDDSSDDYGFDDYDDDDIDFADGFPDSDFDIDDIHGMYPFEIHPVWD
eukprot:GEMP01002995.1.p1 GENE.GEMP01002995.1~~GEMP01002995.1.p1  ORF type:complete len:931 (+),score=204.87 GEMP01002995.1:94-2886(+)